MARQQVPVAILFRHSLLGQGIACGLSQQAGIEPLVGCAADAEAVGRILAARPAMLVYERTEVLDSLDLQAMLPGCHLVDVTHAIAAGSQVPQCQTGLAALAEIVHAMAGTEQVQPAST